MKWVAIMSDALPILSAATILRPMQCPKSDTDAILPFANNYVDDYLEFATGAFVTFSRTMSMESFLASHSVRK